MFHNLGNMNRLQEIHANVDGPDNPKRHHKVENIWRKGNTGDVGVPAPDLQIFHPMKK